MDSNTAKDFKKFLFLQKKAINLIRQYKLLFKNSDSLSELDQAIEILKSEYDLYIKKGEERFNRMLITQDILIQRKRCTSLFSSIYDENKEKGYEIIKAILAIQGFFDNIRENEIPSDEKIALEQDLTKFLSLYKEAIGITKKYIEKFENNSDYEQMLSLLQHGLSYLQGSYDNIESDGITQLRRDKKIENHKRPRLGFFGSFGSAYGSQLRLIDENWADEIVDSLEAIESFFKNT